MANYQYIEYPPQWKKALAYTSGVYIAILLVLYFVYIHTQKAATEEILSGGIEINYGPDETGIGKDYTSMEAVSASPNATNRTTQETREGIVPDAHPVHAADERRITNHDFDDHTAVTSSNNPDDRTHQDRE